MQTESRNTLLVVDDVESNIDILLGALGDVYAVRVAMDGESALRSVEKSPPNLILLDVMMPGMDGFEVCRRLKASETTRDIPIIFLTALTEDLDQVHGLELGAVDYITKPFNPGLVRARVRNHIDLRNAQLDVLAQRAQIEDDYLKLSHLEQSRDELVHLIVHDMRSLITVIYGRLELLELEFEDRQETKIAHGLTTALVATRRLTNMATSLLDVSRLEAGEMPIHLQECDMLRVVQSACASWETLSLDQTVTIDAPERKTSLLCDSDIMLRVIQNLFGNAITHTPKGSSVRIEICSEDAWLRVSVTDDGPGIPQDKHRMIFNKFGQVGNQSGCRKYSSGLGLYFCKLAVEAHGGNISIESELGKGSTFHVRLPAADVMRAAVQGS